MAVNPIAEIEKWIGAHGDDKPTPEFPGSQFYEVGEDDKVTLYIWDGAEWRKDKVTAQLTGSKAEEASAQETETATTVETYNRAAGATEIGVFVESGFVRVRTDGDPATPTTGAPLGEGFFEYYAVATISVYFVQESTITVVSK